jgi:magnesium chelatase family protein
MIGHAAGGRNRAADERTRRCEFPKVWQGETYPVEVQCDTGPGLKSFDVEGLPEVTVRESRVSMRSAITNAAYRFPDKRTIINLAPADVPKRGTLYDLPQAIALMAANGLAAQF